MSLQKQRGIYIKSQEWKRDEFIEFLDEQIGFVRGMLDKTTHNVSYAHLTGLLDSLILTKGKFTEIYK